MEKALKRLSDIIELQSEGYRQLMTLFRDEREAIIQSNIDGLNEVIQKKENQLEAIRRMEQQRIGAVETVASLLHVDANGLTLRRLAQTVPEPYAGIFGELADRCKTLFDEVQAESDTNRSLCLQALAFVNGSLRMLGQLTTPWHVYQASGQVEIKTATGKMLSGAA